MSRVEEALPSENRTPEKRKSMKPIMEKRRRARINNSLNDLKVLILEAMKKDTSCFTKLEKADILAMTVQYLKSVRQQQINSPRSSDPDAMANYRAGYNECAAEATRFLMNCQGLDPQVRTRILSHLSMCLQAVRAPATETTTRPTPPTSTATTAQFTPVLPSLTSTTPPFRTPSAVTATNQYTPILSPLNTTQFRAHVRAPHESASTLGSVHYQILPGTLPNGRLAAVLLPAENVASGVTGQSFQPQVIPLYHSTGVAEAPVEERQIQSFQVPSGMTLRYGNEPVWRPF